MLPQKFLMMKCIRIIFLLHVVGILFFAYKLYSNVGSHKGGGSESSSRGDSGLEAGDNFTLSSNNEHEFYEDDLDEDQDQDEDIGIIATEEENADLVEDISTVESDEDSEDTPDQYDEAEDEIETARQIDDVDDDDDVTAEDYVDDTNENENTEEDVEEDDYDTELEEDNDSDNSVSSVKNVKSGNQGLSFKTEQVKPAAVPSEALKNAHWTLADAGLYSKSLYSSPTNERPIQRLPQAIVIGSPNSGIRPLVDFLEIHPQIIPLKKEIRFFDDQNRLQLFTNLFLSQMPLSYSNQITVARTRFSHWTKKTACDMYARSRNMKVIVVLRDPVSRILSQATTSSIEWDGQLIVAKHGHTMKVNNDTEPIEWGRYVEYLKMWIQCFPKSQIHIVEWSDIMQRPAQTVHKIEAFLGVPYKAREENFHRDEVKRVYCIRPLHIKRMVCLSQNKGKSPTLSPSVEAMIYRFYSKHNEELFRLLGQRFQWGPGA